MRGKSLLVRARTTARAGRARVTLRTARPLRSGRYTVTIARDNGPTIVRRALRVR